jgi:hypothetical protein
MPVEVPWEAYDEQDSNRTIAITDEVLRFVDGRLGQLGNE